MARVGDVVELSDVEVVEPVDAEESLVAKEVAAETDCAPESNNP